jgi:hypothetical protein
METLISNRFELTNGEKEGKDQATPKEANGQA